ncbi:hypothetical protein ACLOJK_026686 [Asimina triloba]
MAEAALSAFLQIIFEKIALPVLKEFGLFKDLHKDMENLRSSLFTILDEDVWVKDWLKTLKDAAYDAEIILDQCRTEALRRKFKTQGRVTKKFRDFFSASNPGLFNLRMAHKIKDIRERLHDIAEERSKFHLREGVCILETKGQEKTDSFVIESDGFGRNEDKEKQRAFGQGRQANINLINPGKEIVKKCSGLPLITKALGGLMYFKEEERESRSVKENEIQNKANGIIGTYLGRKEFDDVMEKLWRNLAEKSGFNSPRGIAGVSYADLGGGRLIEARPLLGVAADDDDDDDAVACSAGFFVFTSSCKITYQKPKLASISSSLSSIAGAGLGLGQVKKIR